MSEILEEIIPPGNGSRWRWFVSIFLVALLFSQFAMFGFIMGTLPGTTGLVSKTEFEQLETDHDVLYRFYLETRINIARELQCHAIADRNQSNMRIAFQALQTLVTEYYQRAGFAYVVPDCDDLVIGLVNLPAPTPQPQLSK